MHAYLFKSTAILSLLALLALGVEAQDRETSARAPRESKRPAAEAPRDKPAQTAAAPAATPTEKTDAAIAKTPAASDPMAPAAPRDMKPFVRKALGWLAESQQKDGGWGGGSHAHQDVKDPAQVPTDPATTAFTAMALLRAGHTPVQGDYRDAVRKATEYLVGVVETSSESGPLITDMKGTQPQAKLGPLVDTSMTVQYLARVLTTLPKDNPLHARVDKALDKCLTKLQVSQKADGSWNFAGWAPVLQSSAGCTALELAQAAGKKIDQKTLDQARKYQKDNFDVASGKAKSEAAAGVELYSFAGAQRANAGGARAAQEVIKQAKREGKLAADAPVSVENLKAAGVSQPQAQAFNSANAQNAKQIERLEGDEQLLSGFGNNGGEEYLSYLMTSESMVLAGGDAWNKWNDKMHVRLEKIQDPRGSWSGQHCITSPVFCTAAVVQCLTTDRDAPMLVKIAKAATVKK